MFNTKTFNSAVFNNTTRHFASVHLVGEGPLTVKGSIRALGSVNVIGEGELSVRGVRRKIAIVSMTGEGTLTGKPVRWRIGAVNLVGIGTLSATPTRRRLGSIYLEGHGHLSIPRGVAAGILIGSDGTLSPLGVLVLRDSREELIPSTRDYSETIPGRHGEIDFGGTFNARVLELHVVTPEGIEKSQVKRKLAGYLNLRPKTLIFLDDMEKMYTVKYAGKIDLNQYRNWFEFTIPFKMHNPFILETFENTHTGNGTLTNNGTYETPVVVEIKGPATNPQITLNNQTMKYTGTLSASDVIVIDTENMTVAFNGVNALANYNGVFPMLQPGDNPVTAGSNITFRWRSRWL